MRLIANHGVLMPLPGDQTFALVYREGRPVIKLADLSSCILRGDSSEATSESTV